MNLEYLITASLGFLILYVSYKAALSKLTFFQSNRWVILLGSTTVILAPLIPIDQGVLTELGVNGVIQLPEIEIGPSRWVGSTASLFSLGKAIYWTGFSLAFSWLAWSIYSAIKTISNGERIRSVVMASATTPAFSFFGTIVIPEGTDDLEYEAIVRHELVHADQLHSIDRIAFGLIKAVFWFNPFVWLLGKELVQVHEYLADEGTVEQMDKVKYSQVLLNLATGLPVSLRTNTVNAFSEKSIIKNRFKMMNSKRSNSLARFRYALILPFMATSILLISCSENLSGQVDGKVYDKVEVMPEYPGGFDKLIGYMTEAIKYPEDAQKEGIEGKVMVGFTVDEDGNVLNVEAKNEVYPSIDKQAIEVVSKMPQWKPGMQDGKKVKVKMVLPIAYKLKDGDSEENPPPPPPPAPPKAPEPPKD